MIKEEKETYESLHEYFKEQDRLISEGKMRKPQFTYDVFTPEEQAEYDNGKTLEEIFNNPKQKNDKK